MVDTKTTLLSILSFLVLNLSAQNVESSIGFPYKYSSKTYHSKHLAKTKESIILLRKNYKNNVFHIDYYDFKMKLKDSKEINYSKNELKIIDIEFSNGKFIVLSTQYSKQDQTFTLFGSTGSIEEILQGQTIEIGQIPAEKIKDVSVQTRYSENKTQFLINCTFPNEKKLARLHYYVLNLDLKQQDFAKVEIPLNINEFELIESGISNQGDLHFITRKKIERKYKFEFISFFFFFLAIREKELAFDKNIPKKIQLLVTDDNVAAIALLSDFNQRMVTNIYFINLDCTKKEYTKPVFENLTEALSNSSEGRSYDYYMHKVHQSEGTIFITLEYYSTKQSISYDSFGAAHTTYYYNYNDLVIFALDENGSKKWSQIITKKQTSVNDRGYGLGTGILTQRGKLLVTFNSNIKNTEFGEKYTLNNIKRSNLVCYIFDEEGKRTKQVIGNTKKIGFTFQPQFNLTSKNSLLITGTRSSSTSLMRITF